MSKQISVNFPHSLLASVVTCELSGMGSTEERLDDLRRRKAIAAAGGGAQRVDAQHAKGKLTARKDWICY